jgi:hypothetical protein
MSGAIHPLPHYAFMAWCLVKHRDNFTFNDLREEVEMNEISIIIKHYENME